MATRLDKIFQIDAIKRFELGRKIMGCSATTSMEEIEKLNVMDTDTTDVLSHYYYNLVVDAANEMDLAGEIPYANLDLHVLSHDDENLILTMRGSRISIGGSVGTDRRSVALWLLSDELYRSLFGRGKPDAVKILDAICTLIVAGASLDYACHLANLKGFNLDPLRVKGKINETWQDMYLLGYYMFHYAQRLLCPENATLDQEHEHAMVAVSRANSILNQARGYADISIARIPRQEPLADWEQELTSSTD